jgi:hypothetical protein
MLTTSVLVLATLAQGPDFSWSGTVARGKEVRVRNVTGDVTVEPARGGGVEVTAVKRAGRRGRVEDVTVRRVETARGVEFCVVYPTAQFEEGTCEWRRERGHDRRPEERNDTRVDFTVRLPAGVEVNAGTVSGDVLASGLRADAELASVSGSVEARDVVAAKLDAKTVSGSVRLADIQADEVGAETVSGDVTFSGPLRARGSYDFQTLSGDVEVRIPRGTGAGVEATTFSGRFESAFPLTSESSTRQRRWAQRLRVRGTIGGGGASLWLQSFSGDVEIRELPGR